MSRLEDRLPQKRVLITGATSGFGEALACLLAARGWRVAVTGRKLDAVQRTAEKVDALGGVGLGMQLEVREKDQWQAVHEALEHAWGGIDLLVNNAGVADANKFASMDDAAWDNLLATNLDGVILGCRTFVPDMCARKSGYILNVSSSAGLLNMPEMANYNVSKAGVNALSETLFTELSGCNVGVTALCPAGFSSSLADNAARDGRSIADSPTGRAVKADMDKGKHTSQTVAAFALRAMEKGHLYSIPQPEYRFLWMLKRLMPTTFYKIVGWLYRNQIGPFTS
jgi:NADP-dependent 3-hydroxy acid dehydrogenase YdfG